MYTTVKEIQLAILRNDSEINGIPLPYSQVEAIFQIKSFAFHKALEIYQQHFQNKHTSLPHCKTEVNSSLI